MTPARLSCTVSKVSVECLTQAVGFVMGLFSKRLTWRWPFSPTHLQPNWHQTLDYGWEDTWDDRSFLSLTCFWVVFFFFCILLKTCKQEKPAKTIFVAIFIQFLLSHSPQNEIFTRQENQTVKVERIPSVRNICSQHCCKWKQKDGWAFTLALIQCPFLT